MQAQKRFLDRFLHEASRIVQLRHSSLLPLFGYGEEDGLPYLIIPDVTGETLASHLRRKLGSIRDIADPRARRCCTQLYP